MQGLRLFAGNRLEILAHRLSENLRKPLSSPLAREIIVVQSKGMEHWLSMQLAKSHGICSNCWFPFPNTMMHLLFKLVLEDMPESEVFDAETTTWKIMGLLPGLLDRPGFESLRSYLQDDPRGLKLHQLSSCLAEIYDSYVIFRPEMVLGWQESASTLPEHVRPLETWQSALWKEMAAGHEHEHMASLRERFLSSLSRADVPLLPERISLFGISYLPPFYLEVFHALSSCIPVSFYLLNPCRQYWGDIRSKSEIARMSILHRETVQELYLEEGNSLLASLGAVGRDLFDILQEFEPQEFDAFVDVEADTLLGSVQADILDLVNPGPDGRRVVEEGDDSVQIHSCHSPMREIEVLRDSLLALFDQDPGLRPEEVVVMSPDIELYAPFIQAVFDVPRSSREFIPYVVVDRSLRTASTLADALLAILELSMSRFEASRVLALLETEPLRKRFGLVEGDLELITRWVRETGIRWGLDAGWKQENGLPGFCENTWDFGLDRMLLGYAMTSEGGRGFASILPYDDIEGDSSQVLGSFLSFLRLLFERVGSFRSPRTLEQWSSVLLELLDRFFLTDEAQVSQANALRAIFRRLSDIREKAGFDALVSLEVIRAWLKRTLGTVNEGRSFLSGGVTFCAMLPMRSVPFKVVCMIGMNHGDFPRQQRAKGFDLIGHLPRKGDCNLRNKDLYLFLEALISARQVFYVSYIGQNMQDNSPIPPSVAVSALLDYLDAGCCTGEGGPAKHRVLKVHCLQAFNPRYFSPGETLFSFSAENAAAAGMLVKGGKQDRLFLEHELPDPGDEWRTVDIRALCSFFRNPSRYLLRRRLMMTLPQDEPLLEDIEPVDLNELQLYELRQAHITHLLEGLDDESSFEIIRMNGSLPHGVPGEIKFSKISSESGTFVRTVRQCIAGNEPLNRLIELPVGAFTLSGSMRTYGLDRAVIYRSARMKGSDLFTAWIHHLVLCTMSRTPGTRTFYVARDEVAQFIPVEGCLEILQSILEAYWQGLKQPLPFFPAASWEYISASARGGSLPDAEGLSKARASWEGSQFARGESSDYAHQVCFQGRDPLGEQFERIARLLFEPLIDHRRQGKP